MKKILANTLFMGAIFSAATAMSSSLDGFGSFKVASTHSSLDISTNQERLQVYANGCIITENKGKRRVYEVSSTTARSLLKTLSEDVYKGNVKGFHRSVENPDKTWTGAPESSFCRTMN